jgi:Short C-terminal domain
VRRTLSYTMLFLTTLLAGCAAGPPGPPALPLGPGLEWMGFLLVAIAGVVWLTRNGLSQYWRSGSGTGSSHAYDVLRERYAKGEISREEYLRVASDLEAHERR